MTDETDKRPSRRDNQVYLVPVEGRTVREHVSKLPFPEKGMWVPDGDMHWMSLLAFGDLAEAEPPAEAEAAEPVPEPAPPPPADKPEMEPAALVGPAPTHDSAS